MEVLASWLVTVHPVHPGPFMREGWMWRHKHPMMVWSLVILWNLFSASKRWDAKKNTRDGLLEWSIPLATRDCAGPQESGNNEVRWKQRMIASSHWWTGSGGHVMVKWLPRQIVRNRPIHLLDHVMFVICRCLCNGRMARLQGWDKRKIDPCPTVFFSWALDMWNGCGVAHVFHGHLMVPTWRAVSRKTSHRDDTR